MGPSRKGDGEGWKSGQGEQDWLSSTAALVWHVQEAPVLGFWLHQGNLYGRSPWGIMSAFCFHFLCLYLLFSSSSSCSPSPSVCSGLASSVLVIGPGVMHPGRDEMAASICAAPPEAVGTGLGNEAVKTTGSSQTNFQNLSPAKCSPGCCCHLCQAEPMPQSPSAWLSAGCHGSALAEGTQPFPALWTLCWEDFPHRKGQLWGLLLQGGLQHQEQGYCPAHGQ